MKPHETALRSLRSPSRYPLRHGRLKDLAATIADSVEKLQGLHDLFWLHAEITDTCWLWTAAHGYKGYGQFGIDGCLYPAHRVAYLLSGHFIPEGYQVLHSCDNPPCVNPAHLRAGTAKENSQDMVERGRWRGGHGGPGRQKLSPREVREICTRLQNGESGRALATEFGVPYTHVYKLARHQRSLSVSTTEVSS